MTQWLPNYGVDCSHNLFLNRETLPPNEQILVRAPESEIYRYILPPDDQNMELYGQLRVMPLSFYRDSRTLNVRSDRREGQLTHNPGGCDNLVAWLATDCYCLCMSVFSTQYLCAKFSDRRTGTMATCFRISPIGRFASIVDRAIRLAVKEMGMTVVSSVAGFVSYCDFPGLRFDGYGCALHPAFIKPFVSMATEPAWVIQHCKRNRSIDFGNAYWLEGEYRLVWDLGTADRRLKPLHIFCPEITSLLSRIDPCELETNETLYEKMVKIYDKRLHEEWIQHCESRRKKPVIN